MLSGLPLAIIILGLYLLTGIATGYRCYTAIHNTKYEHFGRNAGRIELYRGITFIDAATAFIILLWPAVWIGTGTALLYLGYKTHVQ